MKERPQITHGATVRAVTGCGNFYITLNEADAELFEVFTHMGKAGGCKSVEKAAIAIGISVALRSGADPFDFMRQYVDMQCESSMGEAGIKSCPDAIGKVIGFWMGYYDEDLKLLKPDEMKTCELCGHNGGYWFTCSKCGKIVCLKCSPRTFQKYDECRDCRLKGKNKSVITFEDLEKGVKETFEKFNVIDDMRKRGYLYDERSKLFNKDKTVTPEPRGNDHITYEVVADARNTFEVGMFLEQLYDSEVIDDDFSIHGGMTELGWTYSDDEGGKGCTTLFWKLDIIDGKEFYREISWNQIQDVDTLDELKERVDHILRLARTADEKPELFSVHAAMKQNGWRYDEHNETFYKEDRVEGESVYSYEIQLGEIKDMTGMSTLQERIEHLLNICDAKPADLSKLSDSDSSLPEISETPTVLQRIQTMRKAELLELAERENLDLRGLTKRSPGFKIRTRVKNAWISYLKMKHEEGDE